MRGRESRLEEGNLKMISLVWRECHQKVRRRRMIGQIVISAVGRDGIYNEQDSPKDSCAGPCVIMEYAQERFGVPGSEVA